MYPMTSIDRVELTASSDWLLEEEVEPVDGIGQKDRRDELLCGCSPHALIPAVNGMGWDEMTNRVNEDQPELHLGR